MLVLSGAVLVGLSSDALTSMSADRGVSVDVASDPNAVVGLTYPNDVSGAGEQRVIELRSDDADRGGCFWIFCSDYGYENVELVRISDALGSDSLQIDELDYETTNQEMADLSNESPVDALRTVEGTFSCDNRFGYQQAANATATMTLAVSDTDGTFSVELTREIRVECVPD